MKKIFLIVVSFCFLLSGIAQKQAAKYSFKQFIGNWQEKERKNLEGNAISIPDVDTLYFSVANDAKSVLYQGTSTPLSDNFKIKTGNEIEISFNDYSVVSFSYEKLVLKAFDKPDVHTMIKVSSFNFLTKERKICNTCSIEISEKVFRQKWISRPELYANSFIKSDPAIYSLDITQKKSENEYAGILTLGNFSMDNVLGRSGTRSEDCTVSLAGKSITVQSASFNCTGQLFEATNTSLIFTDKKLIYKLSPEIPGQKPVYPYGTNTIDLSSPANLIHNWYAYNRNGNPGFTSAQGLISNLNIINALSALNYEGTVSFTDNNRKFFIVDCRVTFKVPNGEPWIKIETKDKTKVWDFQLYKADGKDLIFGNKLKDGIQYSFDFQ